MPNNQVSPGVRGTENEQATTSPADATDVGAFAGLFQWGPVEERTLITSNARNRNRSLEQRFGKPRRNFNQESWFAAASYLDYSRVLYVSRGLAPGARNAVGGSSVASFTLTEGTLGSWTQSAAAVNTGYLVDGDIAQNATITTITVDGTVTNAPGNGDVISVGSNTFVVNGEPTATEIPVVSSTVTTAISDNTPVQRFPFDVDQIILDGTLLLIRPTDAQRPAVSSLRNGDKIAVKVGTAASSDEVLAADATNVGATYILTLGGSKSGSGTVAVTINERSISFIGSQYTGTSKSADGYNIADVVIKNFANFESTVEDSIDKRVAFASRWPGRLGNSIEVHVCDNKFAWGYDSSELGSDSYWVEVVAGANTVSVYGAATGGTALTTNPGDIKDGRAFRIAGNAHTLSVAADGTVTLDSNFSGTGGRYPLTTADWQYRNSVEADVPGQSVAIAGARNDDGNAFAVQDELHIVVTDRLGEFTGTVGGILERWPSLSRYEEARDDSGSAIYYKDVINRRSQYIWAAKDLEEESGGDSYTSNDIEDLAGVGIDAPKVIPMIGGDDGYNTDADKTKSNRANESNVDLGGIQTAWDVFRGGIDVDFLIAGKAQDGKPHAIRNHLRSIREERGNDCVVTASPPRNVVVNNPGREVQGSIDWAASIQSDSYLFIDTGYKRMYDRYNDVDIFVPMNGDTAGLMASTNAPWLSPAGRVKGQIRNASGLSFNPDARGDRDRLYVNRINPVLSQPGRGIYLYGDKTALSRNSAFNRINVRRLFITLRKIVTDISEDAALFDNNDPITRARFVNTVEPELRSIQGGRGISDFYVQCDSQNNPPEVEDDNEFIADIYVKPRRSINYISLNFVSVRTGAQFSEIAR